MSYGEGTSYDLTTARGRDWPTIRQFSVFLENRVGVLLDFVRRFESTGMHVVAMSVVDLADCAIVRAVLSDPDKAFEVFQQAGWAVTQSDLIVVQLPDSTSPLLQICKALLMVEVNIDYAYTLLIGSQNWPALALHVDDQEVAVQTLNQQGFTLFTEADLDY